MNNDKQKVEIAQQIKQARENMPAYIDMVKMQAQMTRIRYLALVAEGFSEVQAIELCKL